MSERTVKVITRPRTMSGKRGGLVLTIPRSEAEDWIARKWADPVPEELQETKPVKSPAKTATAA